MRLSFLGAAHTVTGSCYLLETNDHKILIDCGMFQGSKRIRSQNYDEFNFIPAEIDCVLLTHAHHDHFLCVPQYLNEYSSVVFAAPEGDHELMIKSLIGLFSLV